MLISILTSLQLNLQYNLKLKYFMLCLFYISWAELELEFELKRLQPLQKSLVYENHKYTDIAHFATGLSGLLHIEKADTDLLCRDFSSIETMCCVFIFMQKLGGLNQ